MIKVKDLEMLNDIDVLYNSKIILYGAGDYGHRAVKLLDELEIPVCGFCDSDSGKWKTEYNGYRIFSIEELSAILSEEYIIIITIVRTDCIEQVLKTLESYGILQTDCYTYFGLKYGVELHIEDWRIKETYRKKLKIEKRYIMRLCQEEMNWQLYMRLIMLYYMTIWYWFFSREKLDQRLYLRVC